MKRFTNVLTLAVLGFLIAGFLGGCLDSSAKPDLVVVAFEIKGPFTFDAEDRAVVPVQVVLKNQGAVAAGIFKTAIMYTDNGVKHVVSFTVPEESQPRYPYSREPLQPGEEMVFNGAVVFEPSQQGMMVSLHAVADSCDEEEHLPAYCRIEESNENNNESDPVSVTLP